MEVSEYLEWSAWYEGLIPCPKCGDKLFVCDREWNVQQGQTEYNRWCYACGHSWNEEGDKNGMFMGSNEPNTVCRSDAKTN